MTAVDTQSALAAALNVVGFTSFSIAGVTGPHLAPLDAALARADRTYVEPDGQPHWDAVASHLRALSTLNVQTVATRYEDNSLTVVFHRNTPGTSVRVPELQQYFHAMELWLAEFGKLVPHIKLTTAGEAAVTGIVATASADLVTMGAASLLIQLADASSNVDTLALIPLGSPVHPEFNDLFSKTDLVTQPWQAPTFKIWGWEWTTGHPMHLPGHSGVESPSPGAGIASSDLSTLLAQAAPL